MVFATHNVVSDPAFSRLDLVSCRNLLIYLDHEAQKRVTPVFHYALREGGFLILGGAESVVNLERQFQAVSPKWRVYRRVGAAGERVPPPFPLEPAGKSRTRPPVGLHPPARSLTEITQQLTLGPLGTGLGPGGPAIPRAGAVRPYGPLLCGSLPARWTSNC